MSRKPTMTLHGIPNCDVIRKARAWLDGRGLAYAFHDYRAQGVTRVMLEGWARRVGWEKLLNRASTTFKELPEARKQNLTEDKAIALMLAQPTMIKRPVLLLDSGALLVGFKPEDYEKAVEPRR